MSDKIVSSLPLPIFAGQTEMAAYRDQPVPHYRGNPLIEALPPIWTMQEATRLLGHYPSYEEQHRRLPAELRLHLILNAIPFFEPLPIHLDIEQRFSRMIRMGYQARNPLQRGFWREMHQRVQSLGVLDAVHGVPNAQPSTAQPRLRSTAMGFTILGLSGVGKSTSVETLLALYPQVIYHSKYHGQDFNWVQLVWLKLDCPFDGSIKGLCLNFFQAVDNLIGTNYYEHYAGRGRITTDVLIQCVARVGSLHGLGVLVIDEIQNLSEAKSGGGSKMLNFLVQLVNTIGVPVVPIGTYKALPLLRGEFRQARRGSGQGDLVWDRMAEDDIWQLFVESLWRYQYVRRATKLTAELSHVLYDVSQGITDFAVKAYLLAQVRAITSGKEAITESVIRSVAADSFRLANPVLDMLRKGDRQALASLESRDVCPVDLDSHVQEALHQLADHRRSGGSRDPGAPQATAPEQSRSASPEPPSSASSDGASLTNQEHPCHPGDRVGYNAAPGRSLQQVVAEGDQRQIAACEALRQAGLVKSALEFLETEARS
jgi:hypothetical protein